MAGAKKKTKKSKKTKQTKQVWYKKWLRRLLALILFILFLPYFLVLLYKLEFVHPVSTLMLGDLLQGRSYEREWVEFNDIAPVLVQSVMMSEDGQYCSHSGVDWSAINIVIEDTLSGDGVRGASTIAMQTSKNLFLVPNRSVIRKVLEMPLAIFSDFIWGKERMMELYLNVAQWGPGIYGIQSASKIYFGRSAKNLTRRQAAYLAVTLPNPILRNPLKPSQGLQRLAQRIEVRAKQSGAYIKCIYP